MESHTLAPPYYAATLHSNLERFLIEGPDARDFLNRLTTIDLRHIPNVLPTLRLGAILTPLGKINSIFFVQILTKEFFVIFAPINMETAEKFERMHFRENLKIMPATQTHQLQDGIGIIETWVTQDPLLTETIAILRTRNTTLLSNEIPQALTQCFYLGSLPQTTAPYSTETLASLFEIGSFAVELRADVIPLEISWGIAVDENKGCYPGQEVIERLRTMGKPPRILKSFNSKNTPRLTEKIFFHSKESDAAQPQEIGSITHITAQSDTIFVRALIKRTAVGLLDNGIIQTESGAQLALIH